MHHATLKTNTAARIQAFRDNPKPEGAGARPMTAEEVTSYTDYVSETFDYVKEHDNGKFDRDERNGHLDSSRTKQVDGFAGDYTSREEKQGDYNSRSYNLVETNEVRSESPSLNSDQAAYNFGQVEEGFIVGANYNIQDNTVSGTEFRIDLAHPEKSVVRKLQPATARGI